MPRETVDAKAIRYLHEGRLRIDHANAATADVAAICHGTNAIHQLCDNQDDGWWCNCPARRTCGHLLARQRVAACPVSHPTHREP